MTSGFRSWIAGILGRFSSRPAPISWPDYGSVQPVLAANWRLLLMGDDLENTTMAFSAPSAATFPALAPLTDLWDDVL